MIQIKCAKTMTVNATLIFAELKMIPTLKNNIIIECMLGPLDKHKLTNSSLRFKKSY